MIQELIPKILIQTRNSFKVYFLGVVIDVQERQSSLMTFKKITYTENVFNLSSHIHDPIFRFHSYHYIVMRNLHYASKVHRLRHFPSCSYQIMYTYVI